MTDETTGRLKLLSAEEMGAKLEAYSWGQTETEVTLTVSGLPKETHTKDVSFHTTSSRLTLSVHGRLVLDGDLHAPVVSDESYFQIDADDDEHASITVRLTKTKRTSANMHWPTVVVGEPEIDVSRFGDPVVAFNENDKADVSAYLKYMEACEAGTIPDP